MECMCCQCLALLAINIWTEQQGIVCINIRPITCQSAVTCEIVKCPGTRVVVRADHPLTICACSAKSANSVAYAPIVSDYSQRWPKSAYVKCTIDVYNTFATVYNKLLIIWIALYRNNRTCCWSLWTVMCFNFQCRFKLLFAQQAMFEWWYVCKWRLFHWFPLFMWCRLRWNQLWCSVSNLL